MGITEDHLRLMRYLSPDMKALLADGQFLVDDSKRHRVSPLTDFSYLVFPFAKLYEGFLKQLFLDMQIISETDYKSDHFRIGKVLSPNLARRLGEKSAYRHMSDRYGKEFAARLWHTWKEGRNLVFHYFPHNFRRLSQGEAVSIITTLVNTMTEAVSLLQVGEKVA